MVTTRVGAFKYAYPRKRGPRRYGSFGAGKGKGKVGGQYQMSSSQRGYLRRGGFYGRYANGGELKFHDIVVDDAIVASAGAIQNGGTINIIAQGVTESERVGRKCSIKKIHWRYTLSMPPVDAQALPAVPDVCRVILYVDKQTNGAPAVVLDILQTAQYHSYRNLSQSGRFVILLDRLHQMNHQTGWSDAAGVSSQAGTTMERTYNKNCNIPIEYDDTASTGVLTTIRTNNLGVLLISRNGICGFASTFRLRFSDS